MYFGSGRWLRACSGEDGFVSGLRAKVNRGLCGLPWDAFDLDLEGGAGWSSAPPAG